MRLADMTAGAPPVEITVNESGCWVWGGGRFDTGYGYINLGSRTDGTSRRERAHRFVYELAVGPIPAGLELDHLCRVRLCVNPAHLEAVTHRENVLRGQGLAALNAVKTHCPQGHGYTPENTYVTTLGRRICRSCHEAHSIAFRQRNYALGLTAHGKQRRRRKAAS